MVSKKKLKFQAPTGMHDILPERQRYFQEIYKVVKNIADFYKFGEITTPIVEEAELFSRGIGAGTDIVGKQMYTFRTRGGDWLAMRPEGTAPIVRSYIEHGMHALPQPIKLWYFGPFFRYEKPQSGRYRQFWQFGFEVLGEKSATVDAQIIQIFYKILKELKFDNLIIQINSIGDSQCRSYYKRLLVNYLKSRQSSLCIDCRRRFKEDPLRIFDCKEEKCQKIVEFAPQTIDHLCKDCHDHLKEVLEFLDDLSLPYRLNTHLVRGLDYYTKTVFEIFPAEEEIPSSLFVSEEKQEGSKDVAVTPLAKNALGGGGRYDSLVKVLGGRDTPACGGAVGIERIIELMKIKRIQPSRSSSPKIFLAQLGKRAKRESLKLVEEFREAKVPIAVAFDRDSLRSQLRLADRLGVKYTLILGQKEVIEKEILIRDMKTGKQKASKMKGIVREMRRKI